MAKPATLPTFEVDKKGLAQLIADRPKAFIVYELVQNAWDEASTRVEVTISMVGSSRCSITVTDDNPEGFANIAHAYTLFAESRKKGDPEKRGRFNLGEKLVIALAEEATITTTKGQVVFNKEGRSMRPFAQDAGTTFTGIFRITEREYRAMMHDVEKLIPPRNIETICNGYSLGTTASDYSKSPIGQCFAQLPTVLADGDGNLRPTVRKTSVLFYDAGDSQAMLYEMGIPVVEIDCGFHVNVQQKVPLNADRDNVTPAYLRAIQTVTLNHMTQGDLIKGDAAAKPWINEALESKDIKVEAVAAIIKERYGDKVVITDPSDQEGTKMATAAGYTVLPARAFSKEAWINVKASGVLPAGQVTPSPKPYAVNGRPENVLDPLEDWTPEMHATAQFMVAAAQRLLSRRITIKIVNEPTVAWMANYGAGYSLTLNLPHLGHSFFQRPGSARQLELILHEFAHETVSDHLSLKFADEICRLAAKLVLFLAGHGAGESLNIRKEDL